MSKNETQRNGMVQRIMLKHAGELEHSTKNSQGMCVVVYSRGTNLNLFSIDKHIFPFQLSPFTKFHFVPHAAYFVVWHLYMY